MTFTQNARVSQKQEAAIQIMNWRYLLYCDGRKYLTKKNLMRPLCHSISYPFPESMAISERAPIFVTQMVTTGILVEDNEAQLAFRFVERVRPLQAYPSSQQATNTYTPR